MRYGVKITDSMYRSNIQVGFPILKLKPILKFDFANPKYVLLSNLCAYHIPKIYAAESLACAK